jgi:hypothetical protein
MTGIAVQGPHCHHEQVVIRGHTHRDTQRYRCSTWCVPEGQHTCMDMRLKASGVRETAGVRRISTDPVHRELRTKAAMRDSINTALRRTVRPATMAVDMPRAGDAEIDEVFLQRTALRDPFGLTRFSTDVWGAYTASRARRASPRQTEHAEHRAPASHTTGAHDTRGPQDHLLLDIDADACHGHWRVGQPIGL